MSAPLDSDIPVRQAHDPELEFADSAGGGGYRMIHNIDIRNFKCFERLSIAGCQRINVVVGENGAGKSALLEAIFLALGSASELVIRYRQNRGLDGSFRGSPQRISDTIFRDLFFNFNTDEPIMITLNGSGTESRSVQISQGPGGTELPLGDDPATMRSRAGMTFRWKDAAGNDHEVVPLMTPSITFPSTAEDLPDFFYFPANITFSAVENAERFSDLSRAKKKNEFVQLFKKEYKWLEDLSIEVMAGSSAIYAAIKNLGDMVPLANVSGGINRVASVLLTIASRPGSVVLVDEMENGLYYKHHRAYWSSLLKFSRNYEGQLFLTTHSKEWLQAMVEATGGDQTDIALWRIERDKNNRPVLFQFQGDAIKDAIEYGAEPRGK